MKQSNKRKERELLYQSSSSPKPEYDLNPPQRRAVFYDEDRPLLVLAGPGSGKTFVITRRIRYLLEKKNVAPDKILVLTFTREAAESMKQRYLDMASQMPELLSDPTQTVNFGTFHSVFYHILKQSPNHHLYENEILKEADKRELLMPVLKKWLPESPVWELQNACPELLAAFGYYKNTGNREEAQRRVPDPFASHFQRLFEAYEVMRRRNCRYDFDDILTDCRRLLAENSGIRAMWQERFDHILIDEFQDCNPIQYEILKLLAKPPYHLFAVGDDDQSIYGFRGAEPFCMQAFLTDFDANREILCVNYRSREEIIEASEKVIRENMQRFEKKIRAAKEGKEKEAQAFCVRKFPDRNQEWKYLKENAKNAGECAILFRTNRMMQRFARYLKQEKILYEMSEKEKDPYENETARDMMAYLKIALGGWEFRDLAAVINKPYRGVGREALTACFYAAKEQKGEDIFEALEKYYHSVSQETAQKIRQLSLQIRRLAKLPSHLALRYIRRVIGYDEWIEKRERKNPERKEEALETMEWLVLEASRQRDLSAWLKEIREGGRQMTEERQGKNGGVKGAFCGLKLMTIHAAKGLEFQKVMIPDCNERIYPHGSMSDSKSIEEERRIFYVGMTRAKEHLELCVLTGSRDNPEEPSRFLHPLRAML